MVVRANRKRCQVHILPTEDGVISKCLQGYSDDPLLTFKTGQLIIETDGHKDWWENQHLYFTTDEEIKEGDWCLKPVYKGGIKIGYGILQVDSSYLGGYGYDWEDHHKIIATTDPKLTNVRQLKDGSGRIKSDIAQPSQAFIKAYCEQGGFDEVDIEYELDSDWHIDTKGLIKCKNCNIIDTNITNRHCNCNLKLKVDPVHNTITTHLIEEKMYSREEVLFLLHDLCIHLQPTVQSHDLTEWTKENL